MKSRLIVSKLFMLTLFIVVQGMLHGQEESQEPPINMRFVASNIYMFEGRGGNIGISVGPDGVFLIDDQIAPVTDTLLANIRRVSQLPVKFVLNTHWHGDHTGGNERMGSMGAVIVAHENVRKRMSAPQFIEFFQNRTDPAPREALPVITFTRDMIFHLNGDEIYVRHFDNAHTDGDAVVYFQRANVLHTGDIFFSGRYPFIDLSSGGSIQGIIDAINSIFGMINQYTKIIPGHGPLSTPDELSTYRSMLVTVSTRVKKLIEDGKTREEVLAARPSREFDLDWGNGTIKPDDFVGFIYDDLTRK